MVRPNHHQDLRQARSEDGPSDPSTETLRCDRFKPDRSKLDATPFERSTRPTTNRIKDDSPYVVLAYRSNSVFCPLMPAVAEILRKRFKCEVVELNFSEGDTEEDLLRCAAMVKNLSKIGGNILFFSDDTLSGTVANALPKGQKADMFLGSFVHDLEDVTHNLFNSKIGLDSSGQGGIEEASRELQSSLCPELYDRLRPDLAIPIERSIAKLHASQNMVIAALRAARPESPSGQIIIVLEKTMNHAPFFHLLINLKRAYLKQFGPDENINQGCLELFCKVKEGSSIDPRSDFHLPVLPDNVTQAIFDKLGYKLPSPQEYFKQCFEMAGYDMEKVVFVDRLSDLRATDFNPDKPSWIFGDRHVLQIGSLNEALSNAEMTLKEKKHLVHVISGHPHKKLLFPIENLVQSLAESHLLNPTELFDSSAVASRLANHMARKIFKH